MEAVDYQRGTLSPGSPGTCLRGAHADPSLCAWDGLAPEGASPRAAVRLLLLPSYSEPRQPVHASDAHDRRCTGQAMHRTGRLIAMPTVRRSWEARRPMDRWTGPPTGPPQHLCISCPALGQLAGPWGCHCCWLHTQTEGRMAPRYSAQAVQGRPVGCSTAQLSGTSLSWMGDMAGGFPRVPGSPGPAGGHHQAIEAEGTTAPHALAWHAGRSLS